jgi:uncharacterized membrane protein/transglutaminase-like putative cysteine protease
MLDAGGLKQITSAIVVGRTLATPATALSATPAPSYFLGELQNNQVTITYTVYDEQADSETGVLLTTTLQPGVTMASASVPPTASGQNLAWILGTIQGFDRASISLTVNLPALPQSQSTPLQIDAGAAAYAMLDSGAVSAAAPAATLQPGNVSDPALIESTPGADTNDLYVQEEAAKLDYNPQNIFNFLHTQIGYNSYVGPLRGARGTLWSSAGNSLDVASLGVALLRASGIPANYVQGMLTQSQAQALILSMFPAQYQTVGYIPAGTPTSDPATDPQLLSETESHYWFQFSTDGGMEDADPLMPGATVGQSFAPATGTFPAIPADLEATTEIRLVAEIDNTADALFGQSGLTDTTVLDQTFDDVTLVGKTLTIGNLVSTNSLSAGDVSTETNTYTPYVIVGGDSFDPASDQTINGQSYQEVLTSFPLSSQILTGLFLTVNLSSPGSAVQSYERTLADRIGTAARQTGGPVNVSASPTGPPLISPLDLATLSITASQFSPAALQSQAPVLAGLGQQLIAYQAQVAAASGTAQAALFGQANDYMEDVFVAMARARLAEFDMVSDTLTAAVGAASGMLAYLDSPRITILSSQLSPGQGSAVNLEFSMDLLNDAIRAIAEPGNDTATTVAFGLNRGLGESAIEASVLGSPPQVPATSTIQLGATVSASTVFQAAVSQAVPLTVLAPNSQASLDVLTIPADAKTLISQALALGEYVIVPSSTVLVAGQSAIAWYEIDPNTGATVGVMENGEHGALEDYTAAQFVAESKSPVASFLLGVITGVDVGTFEKIVFYLVGVAVNGAYSKTTVLRYAVAAKQIYSVLIAKAKALYAALSSLPYPKARIFATGFLLGATIGGALSTDPPIAPYLSDPNFHLLPPTPNTFQGSQTVAASLSSGAVQASIDLAGIEAQGQLKTSWMSQSTGTFQATTLNAASATVRGATGNTIGSGAVSLKGAVPANFSITGTGQYTTSGQGSIAVYGPAETSLGISGDWLNYTASVLGAVTITLAVPAGALLLSGQPLPAGTYIITTSSATLSGSGTTSAPSFSGKASITASGGAVNLGPGSGSLAVGGKPLDPESGATLDGYTGTIVVLAGSGGTDAVSLAGTAGNVLELTTNPAIVTTNQNTPVKLATDVATSLAGTFNLTVNAPSGWTVTVDSQGKVSATPAPGVQGGTFAIQLIAQSQADSNLIAQATVDMTVTPTQPGISLAVNPDPEYTVPVNGAEIHTAFRASLENLGPAADTYTLHVANISSGFTLTTTGSSVTVPSGETGILGIYLTPSPGQPLPPPGTQFAVTVVATSTTDSTITQTVTETFTIPAIDAVTLMATPAGVSAIPGVIATDVLTITNAGNVDDTNITLSGAASGPVTFGGLSPVSLAAGQSTTEAITLTPGAGVPLNSVLDATITATFGPAGSTATQAVTIPVSVVAPGAAAIATAATAANQLGDLDLAAQLGDLSTALTNLVENPTSAVDRGQAQASLSAVAELLSADPVLVSLVPSLKSDGQVLEQAATAGAVQAAVTTLGNDLESIGTALADESAYGFTLGFVGGSSQIVQPQVPASFQFVLADKGSQTATYDLSLSELPSGVMGSLSESSVTLNSGESTGSGNIPVLSVTLTSTSSTTLAPFGFTVTATAEGASELTQSLAGSLTARSAIVQVASVTPSPAFIEPGGQVDVKAHILNAVNKQEQAEVSFTVKSATGTVLYSSSPVATTLNVLSTLSTVDLGNLDTSGFALGDDTITVTVSDDSGNLISGATGTGTLLVGTPVTATESVTPQVVPSGTSTITNSLTIASTETLGNSLSFVGQLPANAFGSATLSGLALNGSDAYVFTNSGVDVVDISSPSSPAFVTSVNDGIAESSGEVVGNKLIGFDPGPVTSIEVDARGGVSYFDLGGTFGTPSNPGYVQSIFFPYQRAASLVVNGNKAFITTNLVGYNTSDQIIDQDGDLLSFDLSNPSNLQFLESLLNTNGTTQGPPPKTTGIWENGGGFNMFQAVLVHPDTLYVAGSTATGSDTEDGVGRIQVVNVADASNMQLLNSSELDIPGTVQAQGIAISGNIALVTASQGGWLNPFTDTSNIGPTGNIVVATLDLSNPLHPTVLGELTIDRSARGMGQPISLGNGEFAFSSLGEPGDSSQIILVNASDPKNPQVFSQHDVATPIEGMQTDGHYLYTSGADGVDVYQVGTGSIPGTVKVTIPTNSGVSAVPNSFNVTPTSTVNNPDGSETLSWDLTLSGTAASETLSWQETVSGVQPGQSLPVSDGSTVTFTSQGTPGALNLPGQLVTAHQIIGIAPATETAKPGATASYTVNLSNPTSNAVAYNLAVEGLAATWVSLSSTVSVPAGGMTSVPLTITSSPFAIAGDIGFAVTATSPSGAAGSVQGDLVVAGQPESPDPNSHGIAVALSPGQASAGQGTSAVYVVELTNTGSADDSFSFSVAGLPAGVTANFGESRLNIPTGTGNSRDALLTLTVAQGTLPRNYPFSVTAASSSDPSVTTTASGKLTVTAGGVNVALRPDSGTPGASFEATVTNTGAATDTYSLSLAGPGALAASLRSSQVTLGPGASQIVPISTGPVNYAVQGSLQLFAVATSMSDSAIESVASANLNIAASHGMTADFSQARQTLSQPGMATFILMVHNTGNAPDSYSATIIGANGPVLATLVGPNGSPAQSIPSFFLPALGTGAIVLEADLASIGQGAVTILVQSQADPAIAATVVATVATPSSPPISTDGPEVARVLRYGYHWMQTTIVVTFNQALDPARAEDAHNYRIIGPGGRIIRVRSAVFDQATHSVTLHPVERINVHHRYKLIINGTGPAGLTNTSGQLLDGTDRGDPGSDYKAALTWRDLVLDPPLHKALPRRPARSVTIKTAPAIHAFSHHGLPLFKLSPAIRR